MNRHVINSIKLELSARNYEDAGIQRSEAKVWANGDFLTIMSKYLDGLASESEWVVIDKLELNIDRLPWHLGEYEWLDVLNRGISESAVERSVYQLILEQWVFYLQGGSHLFNAILKTSGEYAELVTRMSNELFAVHPDLIFKRAPHYSFIIRLTGEYEESVATKVLSWFLEISKDDAVRVYRLLLEMRNADGQSIKALWVKHFATGSVQQSTAKRAFVKDLYTGRQRNLAVSQEQPAQAEKSGTGLECYNTGLVIVFPYLERLFETCGLTENGRFISEQMMKLAVQSLHLLATGESKADDGVLLLPKLICGFDPETYVEIKSELPEFIQQECKELLESVLGHWKALKSSSVDSLREHFLQRRGRLYIDADQFRIEVEESGIDILLNSLPWGFRHFKFPWSRYIIITDWY
jgi:hypothetical protein